MENKLITVIIPTFGRGRFLKRAINSVLEQSYTNFEIIIVDDNGIGTKSQIETYNEISNLLSIDPRIKYLTHSENRNGSAARNTGIQSSKGEYICFLDDDDEFLPDKLLKQYNLLESLGNNWIACYTGHIRCFKEAPQNNYSYEPLVSGDILFPIMNFSVDACSGSTLMMRKEIIKKIHGFNENLKRHQDYEFLAKIAYHGKVAVVTDPMVNIYVHDGSYGHKKYTDIENARHEYIKAVQPYLNSLPIIKQKTISFTNNFELLKKSLLHKKYFQAIKYFCLCKRPFISLFMLSKDSIRFLKKRWN